MPTWEPSASRPSSNDGPGNARLPEHRQVEQPGRSGSIEVTLVTAEGCHYCADAAALLEHLGESHPIRVHTLDLADAEGAAIARRFRIPFPPVLLVDGEYFGHGRISGRKLAKHLASTARKGAEL